MKNSTRGPFGLSGCLLPYVIVQNILRSAGTGTESVPAPRFWKPSILRPVLVPKFESTFRPYFARTLKNHIHPVFRHYPVPGKMKLTRTRSRTRTAWQFLKRYHVTYLQEPRTRKKQTTMLIDSICNN